MEKACFKVCALMLRKQFCLLLCRVTVHRGVVDDCDNIYYRSKKMSHNLAAMGKEPNATNPRQHDICCSTQTKV